MRMIKRKIKDKVVTTRWWRLLIGNRGYCCLIWPTGQGSHHSLVTPIDWKHGLTKIHVDVVHRGHHSLVTPIDWKPLPVDKSLCNSGQMSPLAGDTYWLETVKSSICPLRKTKTVTTRWWHLLIGNQKLKRPVPQRLKASHHSLVTPIDWKLQVVCWINGEYPIWVTTRWWYLLIGNS